MGIIAYDNNPDMYTNGKVCPVCTLTCPMDEFKVKTGRNKYRHRCHKCTNLISTLQAKRLNAKKSGNIIEYFNGLRQKHSERLLKAKTDELRMKYSKAIFIIDMLLIHQDKTETEIVKIMREENALHV
tara:strand:- start:21067 stop:21450 length:384 start_codon:yes stop_codon:yes gene_type:complete